MTDKIKMYQILVVRFGWYFHWTLWLWRDLDWILLELVSPQSKTMYGRLVTALISDIAVDSPIVMTYTSMNIKNTDKQIQLEP